MLSMLLETEQNENKVVLKSVIALMLTLLVTLLIALLMLLDILVSSDLQNRKSAIDTFNKVHNIVTIIGKRTN